jgi:hypothetical protein
LQADVERRVGPPVHCRECPQAVSAEEAAAGDFNVQRDWSCGRAFEAQCRVRPLVLAGRYHHALGQVEGRQHVLVAVVDVEKRIIHGLGEEAAPDPVFAGLEVVLQVGREVVPRSHFPPAHEGLARERLVPDNVAIVVADAGSVHEAEGGIVVGPNFLEGVPEGQGFVREAQRGAKGVVVAVHVGEAALVVEVRLQRVAIEPRRVAVLEVGACDGVLAAAGRVAIREHDADLGLVEHLVRDPCCGQRLGVSRIRAFRAHEQSADAQLVELARQLAACHDVDRLSVHEADIAREEGDAVHFAAEIVSAELEHGGVLQEEVPRLGKEQAEAPGVDLTVIERRVREVRVEGQRTGQRGRELVVEIA